MRTVGVGVLRDALCNRDYGGGIPSPPQIRHHPPTHHGRARGSVPLRWDGRPSHWQAEPRLQRETTPARGRSPKFCVASSGFAGQGPVLRVGGATAPSCGHAQGAITRNGAPHSTAVVNGARVSLPPRGPQRREAATTTARMTIRTFRSRRSTIAPGCSQMRSAYRRGYTM